MAVNPAAEVAWYFPETREQYRVSGNLTIVDAASTDSAMQAVRGGRRRVARRAHIPWMHGRVV